MMMPLLLAYWKTGLLASLAAAGLLLAFPLLDRRYTARWRCRVWIALAVLLLLPLPSVPARAPLRLELPGAAVEPLAAFSGADAAGAMSSDERAQGEAAPVPPPAAGRESAPQAKPAQDALSHIPQTAAAPKTGAAVQLPGPEAPRPLPPSPLSPLALCGAVWAAGAVVLGLWRLGAYLFFLRRALRRARPVTDPRILQAFRLSAAGLGRRTPRLLEAPGLAGPLTAGVLRPVLLLPEGTAADAGLPLMLAHELMHLRRRDIPKKMLLLAANTLHWPNPAVWLLLRRAQRDIELACDEAVVAGRDAAYRNRYCDALLAALPCAEGDAPAPGARFARGKREVRVRLAHLFDRRAKRRGRAAAALLLAAVTACCALVACTAPAASSLPSLSPAAAATPKPDHGATQGEVAWPIREWAYASISGVQSVLFSASTGDFHLPPEIDFPHPSAMGYQTLSGVYSPSGGHWLLAGLDREGRGSLVYFYRSDDNGLSWEQSEYDFAPLLGGLEFDSLVNYEQLNPQTTFLSARVRDGDGRSLLLFHSADGGQSWTLRRELFPGTLGDVRHLRFVNPEVGFATAIDLSCDKTREVYRTVDGGRTWEKLDLWPALRELPLASPVLTSCCLAVHGSDLLVGYTLRSGRNDEVQLLSRDYGETWSWRVRGTGESGCDTLYQINGASWTPLPGFVPTGDAVAPTAPDWPRREWAFSIQEPDGQTQLTARGLQNGSEFYLPFLPELLVRAAGTGGPRAVTGSYLPDENRWDVACRDPDAPDAGLLFARTTDDIRWYFSRCDFSGLLRGGALTRVVSYEPFSDQTAFLSLIETAGPADAPRRTLRVYQTRNGGADWRPRGQIELGDGDARQLRFLNDRVGFASVTIDGKRELLRTRDGGQSWEPLRLDLSALPRQDLVPCCIWVEGGDVVVGLSADSPAAPDAFPDAYCLRSRDGGDSWAWLDADAVRAADNWKALPLSLPWAPL